jgi:hypothetical protein
VLKPLDDRLIRFPPASSVHGLPQVRICKHGQWREVRLDDYFPCFPGGGK